MFVKRVRNGLVAQPTQKSFNLAIWDNAFSAITRPTTEDIRLHEAGKWAFLKFESIRRKLEPVFVTGRSKRDRLSMFVGGANRDCHLLVKLATPVDSEELLVMEQIIQAKLEQPYGFGPARPDEMLLSSVDSLRFPIRMVHSVKELEIETKTSDLEIIERVYISSYLAQIYSIVEGYWMHALWNGLYIDSTTRDDSDLVLPPNHLDPIVTIISDYRRQALMGELLIHFSQEWKYVLTDEQKERFAARFPEVTIVDQASDLRFHVSKKTKPDEEVMISLLKGAQAERGYYAPLVDEPLEKIGAITLRMLLQAWEVLYALSEVLMTTFPTIEDSGVYSIEKLLRYAPAIRKKDLVGLVVQWCNVEEDVAQHIVKFFSYGPHRKGELWGHPLVEISDTEVVPLIAPIRYSNIERTFEQWMRDSGFRLTDKGPLFEAYIRKELIESLNRSELLKDAAVHPSKLILRDGNVEEEIDIVMRVGKTILIGEAKCFLFPSEPIEVARYFDALANAATQVKRKVDFARCNLPRLTDQLGISGSTYEDLAVEPFVVLNQPFGTGFPQGDVPIVDELILKRFFEGKWDRLGIYDKGSLETHSALSLYNNEEEAASKISTYLRYPPQLRHYRQNVRPNIQWYPAVEKSERQFAAVHFEVVLPLPNLELQFDKTRRS